MNEALPQLPLEIGIVLAGKLDTPDHRAVSSAVRIAGQRLESWFPGFTWSLTLHRRPDWGNLGSPEPILWLQQAAEERDANHWDLALKITNVDLLGHYRSFAYAAVSRPLDEQSFHG